MALEEQTGLLGLIRASRAEAMGMGPSADPMEQLFQRMAEGPPDPVQAERPGIGSMILSGLGDAAAGFARAYGVPAPQNYMSGLFERKQAIADKVTENQQQEWLAQQQADRARLEQMRFEAQQEQDKTMAKVLSDLRKGEATHGAGLAADAAAKEQEYKRQQHQWGLDAELDLIKARALAQGDLAKDADERRFQHEEHIAYTQNMYNMWAEGRQQEWQEHMAELDRNFRRWEINRNEDASLARDKFALNTGNLQQFLSNMFQSLDDDVDEVTRGRMSPDQFKQKYERLMDVHMLPMDSPYRDYAMGMLGKYGVPANFVPGSTRSQPTTFSGMFGIPDRASIERGLTEAWRGELQNRGGQAGAASNPFEAWLSEIGGTLPMQGYGRLWEETINKP